MCDVNGGFYISNRNLNATLGGLVSLGASAVYAIGLAVKGLLCMTLLAAPSGKLVLGFLTAASYNAIGAKVVSALNLGKGIDVDIETITYEIFGKIFNVPIGPSFTVR